jgi:hypothetical protein
MNGVKIAIAAEFLQLQSRRRIATILHGGVARNTGRTFVRVRAAFRAFQRYNNAYTFTLGHGYRTNFLLG